LFVVAFCLLFDCCLERKKFVLQKFAIVNTLTGQFQHYRIFVLPYYAGAAMVHAAIFTAIVLVEQPKKTPVINQICFTLSFKECTSSPPW